VPVAAAAIVTVKGYLVAAEFVPDVALSDQFSAWPAITLPVFIAMMFCATLGGNATLVGSSANIVTAGICSREGKPVTFSRFLRYGLPVATAQLVASAIYVLVLSHFMR
jgi:Na+/H+ antiporter NhaD/arsenite permease-like protein